MSHFFATTCCKWHKWARLCICMFMYKSIPFVSYLLLLEQLQPDQTFRTNICELMKWKSCVQIKLKLDSGPRFVVESKKHSIATNLVLAHLLSSFVDLANLLADSSWFVWSLIHLMQMKWCTISATEWAATCATPPTKSLCHCHEFTGLPILRNLGLKHDNHH